MQKINTVSFISLVFSKSLYFLCFCLLGNWSYTGFLSFQLGTFGKIVLLSSMIEKLKLIFIMIFNFFLFLSKLYS